MTICYDGYSRCAVLYNVVSAPQPGTNIVGCFNIDHPQKKMAMHPSSDLNCTLFFHESCKYGAESEKTPQQRWTNVYHGLVAPGIDRFDSEWWKANGFWSDDGHGEPPKSVLCAPKEGARGLGGDN